MSARDYPRASDWMQPRRGSMRACLLCGLAPAGRLLIQTSEFRGDDELLAVCGECRRFPDAAPKAFARSEEVRAAECAAADRRLSDDASRAFDLARASLPAGASIDFDSFCRGFVAGLVRGAERGKGKRGY